MRKVIITGGSRGIGAACVEKFCALGDKVVFIYKQDDEAARKITEKTNSIHLKYDLACYNIACDAVNEAISILGGVDVLVNCAGIAGIRLFCDETEEEYRKMIDTNLTSAIAASKAAAKAMIASKSGCIVNIGSVWGARGASCEVTYSASKSALRGFTQALAKELGPSGIRVNCVEPGVIDTDMNAGLDKDTKKELADGTALCRLGRPAEIAAAVEFLCSDSASFITGAILPVDGGFI